MVEQIARHAQLAARETGKAILGGNVMDVMKAVPRHEFVPVEVRAFAYADSPLPIGYDKTISQPFIVALMTDRLDLQAGDRVLDVGTGLGYQAAILAKLVDRVYTVEILEELADSARRRLAEQEVINVESRIGDGSKGWPEHAPFDKILVAAAPDLIPTSLLAQLKPGGKMVIPAGIEDAQQLMLVEKNEKGQLNVEEILPVRFSSLTVSH
jgi:protein-L-isoaspartate(D-aspartate) O-methyltransferase